MTELELKAFKHSEAMYIIDARSKVEGGSNREKDEAFFNEKAWLSTVENVLELLKNGRDVFRKYVASKIVIDHLNGKINNTCPKCHKLARTPMSKQCQNCFYTCHLNNIDHERTH